VPTALTIRNCVFSLWILYGFQCKHQLFPWTSLANLCSWCKLFCSLWGTDWILKYYLDKIRPQRVELTLVPASSCNRLLRNYWSRFKARMSFILKVLFRFRIRKLGIQFISVSVETHDYYMHTSLHCRKFWTHCIHCKVKVRLTQERSWCKQRGGEFAFSHLAWLILTFIRLCHFCIAWYGKYSSDWRRRQQVRCSTQWWNSHHQLLTCVLSGMLQIYGSNY
jgi:hypothetical protein